MGYPLRPNGRNPLAAFVSSAVARSNGRGFRSAFNDLADNRHTSGEFIPQNFASAAAGQRQQDGDLAGSYCIADRVTAPADPSADHRETTLCGQTVKCFLHDVADMGIDFIVPHQHSHDWRG